MAGVKGRSGSGGARPGAGRPRKNPAVELPPEVPDPVALPDGSFDDPLAYLMHVMNDQSEDTAMRVRAAIAAAQYKNTKLHDGGKKDAQADKAKKASAGKFSAAAPPKLVINNR